jgi:LPXTG-motif cell wall-anchored protein
VTTEELAVLGIAILLALAGFLWIRRIVKDVEEN